MREHNGAIRLRCRTATAGRAPKMNGVAAPAIREASRSAGKRDEGDHNRAPLDQERRIGELTENAIDAAHYFLHPAKRRPALRKLPARGSRQDPMAVNHADG